MYDYLEKPSISLDVKEIYIYIFFILSIRGDL
jgi:hypothetical protein